MEGFKACEYSFICLGQWLKGISCLTIEIHRLQRCKKEYQKPQKKKKKKKKGLQNFNNNYVDPKKKKNNEEENLEELKNKSKHHNTPQPKEPQIFTTNLHPHLQPITSTHWQMVGCEVKTNRENEKKLPLTNS